MIPEERNIARQSRLAGSSLESLFTISVCYDTPPLEVDEPEKSVIAYKNPGRHSMPIRVRSISYASVFASTLLLILGISGASPPLQSQAQEVPLTAAEVTAVISAAATSI